MLMISMSEQNPICEMLSLAHILDREKASMLVSVSHLVGLNPRLEPLILEINGANLVEKQCMLTCE